jgi:hypothetical protein
MSSQFHNVCSCSSKAHPAAELTHFLLAAAHTQCLLPAPDCFSTLVLPQIMQEQEWQSYVDGAFSRMDLDGDGYIDLEELLSELPPAYFQVGMPDRLGRMCCYDRLVGGHVDTVSHTSGMADLSRLNLSCCFNLVDRAGSCVGVM